MERKLLKPVEGCRLSLPKGSRLILHFVPPVDCVFNLERTTHAIPHAENVRVMILRKEPRTDPYSFDGGWNKEEERAHMIYPPFALDRSEDTLESSPEQLEESLDAAIMLNGLTGDRPDPKQARYNTTPISTPFIVALRNAGAIDTVACFALLGWLEKIQATDAYRGRGAPQKGGGPLDWPSTPSIPFFMQPPKKTKHKGASEGF